MRDYLRMDELAERALQLEFAYDEPVARPMPATDEDPGDMRRPAVRRPPPSFLFAECCSPQTAAGEIAISLQANPPEVRKPDTSALIARLMAAEAESIQIVEEARERRRRAVERAKHEAMAEATAYEQLFQTEFAKLQQQHEEELEQFEQEAVRKIDKHLARDTRRGRKKLQEAMLFVLESTCDVSLELSEAAAACLRREAAIEQQRRSTLLSPKKTSREHHISKATSGGPTRNSPTTLNGGSEHSKGKKATLENTHRSFFRSDGPA